MTAEMFGKVTGLGKGKGGHMHLFDPAHKFSCSGIIGASLPPACGAALAAKKMGKDWVAVAFFGEGAANQGVVPRVAEPGGAVEAAGDLRLRRQQVGHLGAQDQRHLHRVGGATAPRPTACPASRWRTTTRSRCTRRLAPAIARARRGEGPSLIEVKTDRYLGHFQGDPEVYRPKDEVANLRKNDPIPKLAAQLKSARPDDGRRTRPPSWRAPSSAWPMPSPSPAQSAYPAPQEALQHVFA